MLSFTLSQGNHGDTVVGENMDGNPTIVLTNAFIKTHWENVINEEGEEIELNLFEIVETESGDYLLLGSNTEKTLAACISLILENGKYYEQLFNNSANGLSVTCTGCMVGCNPSIVNGKGLCSPFCSGCNKSETLTSGGIFQN